MILKVLTVPNPILATKAKLVDDFDKNLLQLLDDMADTMYAHNGCGLAANQIGILKRLVIVDISKKKASEIDPENTQEHDDTPLYLKSSLIKMINPEILWQSKEINIFEEGCLSIPKQYAEIKRPKSVRLKFINEEFQVKEHDVSGFFATCIQHEIDHLNGRVFIDYLTSIKRQILINRVKRLKKK
jgi:peptide deformylase